MDSYGGGEDDPAHHTRIDKITYSTDTTAAVPGFFKCFWSFWKGQQAIQHMVTLVVVVITLVFLKLVHHIWIS